MARVQRGLLLALLLALLQAQGLGLWHRVAHAHRALLVAQADHAERLPFGHQGTDDAQCRLYDQLAASDAVGCAGDVAVAPDGAAPAPRPAPTAAAPAAAARPYQARAPPRG